MSTPRTDAVMQDKNRDGNDLPDLCRTLERELADTRYALKRITDLAEEWCNAVDRDASWDGWDTYYKQMKYGKYGEVSGLESARAALG